MTSIPFRPRTRNDFRVAIICALPLEAGMVRAVFDKVWSDEDFDLGQAEEDRNAYTIGVIGKHNVVLIHMSGMGAVDAATAVTGLRATFPSIDIAFVVGICGTSPTNIATQEEMCLGDCIVSTALIQYDFGRQYPGQFSRKGDVEDNLGRPRPEIRALLARLQTSGVLQELEGKLAQHLQALQKKKPRARYPGAQKDRLFDSDYLHIHRDIAGRCDKCVEGSVVCTKVCSEIGCDETRLKPRTSLAVYEKTQEQRHSRLHFGRYGSANTVLKSGTDRDKYIDTDKIIAFEMEAAGVWESLPTLVVKSACDYADSHKNKEWQDYAAATAAAGLKSILEYWRVVDVPHGSDQALQAANTGLSIDQSIHEADKLIRNYCRSSDRLLIKRLSGQELELGKCYINLAMVDRRKGMEDKEQKMSFSLEARLRLGSSEVDQSISLQNLFESRKLADGKTVDPRRIFIQGRAGIGKTTLCKKIVYEFLEGRLGSNLFDRLLWIPLRGLRSNREEYGWHELLRDTFRISTRTWKEVEGMYGKQFDSSVFLNRTLFLFDGLDEISHRWNDEDPFYSFLKTIIRGVPNVIITSRPQANTFTLESFDLDLETIGFTVDQISIYIRNCVKDSGTAATMEKLIAQKPLIQGLLRIPIQLDAFCYTWHEERGFGVTLSETITQDTLGISNTSNSITMTTLYQSITTELCKKDLRLLGRLEQWQRPSSSEIQDELKGELDLLGEIAFHGLLGDVAEFNPQHWDRLRSFLYKSSAEFSAVFRSTFDRLSFLRTSDHDNDYTKRTYHFIHLTFQEFFAARHFVEHWQQDKPLTCLQLTGRGKPDSKTPLAFLHEEKYNPRYNIFWRFVAGLLSERHGVVTFFLHLDAEPRDLLGATHLRLIMYCLSEVIIYSDVHDLYAQELRQLRQGLVQEYNNTGNARLGAEVEFPENILIDFLESDFKLPYTETLSVLRQRSVLQEQTIEAIARKLTSSYTSKIQLAAAEAIWTHSKICSQQILERAIHALIAALKDEDSDVRWSAASALRAQSSLSEAAISLLIAALKDEDLYVRGSAASALGAQSSLSEAAISILVLILDRDEYYARDILRKQPQFYSMIESLDIPAWKHIWSFWLKSGAHNDVSCYEFADALYVWSDGIRHKIFTDPARIAQFRKVVLSTADDLLNDNIVITPPVTVKKDDALPEKAGMAPKPQPQARSRIPVRKKHIHKQSM